MRIGLKLKSLLVLSIPLSFQTVQLCLLEKTLTTCKQLDPALAGQTSTSLTMIATGLVVSSLLFVLANLISSRSVIRRLSEIQRRIRASRSAIPFSTLSHDWDEIDELELEVSRLLLDSRDEHDFLELDADSQRKVEPVRSIST